MASDYDYIIVGAGSAGCTLARRLSEDPDVRVLLLEAGPDLNKVAERLKEALAEPPHFQLMQDTAVDWKFSTQPAEALDERKIPVPRGRILGGSSTFMAGMCIRGNHRDYDEWAAEGNRGWRYEDVLPYFKKVETNLGTHIDREYHGFDGPMEVTDLPEHTPAGEAFVEASMALGHPHNQDFNGPRQRGVGFFQFYIDQQGRRVNSAWSYLTPEVRDRANLTIRCDALATRVLLARRGRGLRAVGLAYEDVSDGGRTPISVAATREVIVACGTIDSPKLLMLSGIGPRDELAENGIALELNLPGVGQNLQDHIIIPIVYAYKPGTAPERVLGYGIEGGLFWRTNPRLKKPDLQFVFNNSLLGPAGELVRPVAYMVVPTLISPRSHGRVRLGGSFVGSPPRIESRFLTKREDLRALIEGVRQGLSIAEHSAFEAIRGERLAPAPGKGAEKISESEIHDYIRANAGTLYHPAGTCRMGPRAHDRRNPAVVDARLRVHGVQGLRVVDASIMPNVTAGNTHTPTAMIAEKAADMIRIEGKKSTAERPRSKKRRTKAECRAGACKVEPSAEVPLDEPAAPAPAAPAPNEAAGSAPAAPAPASAAPAATPPSSGETVTTPTGPETVAQAYLEILRQVGVRYFFGVLGSDAPSIIDAFARFAAENKTSPTPIMAPHEMVAMSMAHGYYLASGEPQVVMVYDAVGTANATTGVINAARTNVPVIVTSGSTAYHEHAGPTSRVIEPHWGAEARDQGGILRQFVKWDHAVHSSEELEAVVHRAFAIAMSEPRGPVYLRLPIDIMAEPPAAPAESVSSMYVATTPLYPDPRAIEEAVSLLAGASEPLIITRSYGRDPAAVPHLVSLAEALTIPVVEFQIAEHVNFPSDHPLHLGYDPAPFLGHADVILVIDSPVPWAPLFGRPNAAAKVIHLGTDPLYQQIPHRGFDMDLAIAANSSVAVELMVEAASRQPHGGNRRDRFARLKKRHDEQRAQWAREAEAAGQAEHSSPEWVSEIVGRYLDDSTLVVQEYDLKLKHTGFKTPGTYFGFSPAGGLGYGGGAALGVKLAAPDKTVISVLGDGTYVLGVPSACHMVSAAYDLPVLWILTNNHGWGAVKLETQLVHPQGWSARTGNFPMTRFGAEPAYEKFSEAVGGAGEAVVKPQELPAAVERALDIVRREGRQVLLNVDCGEPSFTV